jgi:hypothetical protein
VAKHRRRTVEPSIRWVLDSGALIAESKGNPRLRALIREGLNKRAALIVPPIVVTETYREDATDVGLNRLLGSVVVPETDFELAKVAGRLLAATGTSNAPDAQVVAEALRRAPCTILTSDYDDIAQLVNGLEGITVRDVGKL